MNVLRVMHWGAIALAATLIVSANADARTPHRAHHRHSHHAQAQSHRVKNPFAHTAVMNAGELTQTYLPVDEVTTVNGIEMGCTGIGLDAREDPRWERFKVRFEFSGAYHQYIPGGRLVVKTWEGKNPIIHVRCDAPWVLADLEPGKYRVAGVMGGYSHPQSWVMKLKPNRKKTRRIVLHFDEVKGAEP